jgi:hypothetical protein
MTQLSGKKCQSVNVCRIVERSRETYAVPMKTKTVVVAGATGKLGQLVRQSLGTLEALQNEIQVRRLREPENVYSWLPLMYAAGMFGGKATLGSLANGRYPEIKPESVRDTVMRGAWQ